MADQNNLRVALAVQDEVSFWSGNHGIGVLKIKGGSCAGGDIDCRSISRKNLFHGDEAAYLCFDDRLLRVGIVRWIGAADVQLMIQEDHVVIPTAMRGHGCKFVG